MPHGQLILGGPVFVFALVFFGLTALLALFVVIDSLRRSEAAFARLPEPRGLYTIPQAMYLVVFVLALVPVVTRIVGLPLVLFTPFALIEQVVYLLRVVFPKPQEPAAEAGVSEAPDADVPDTRGDLS